MVSLKLRNLLAATILVAASGLCSADAGPRLQTFGADYIVSYYGIVLAKSHFTSYVSDKAFRLEGTIASAGIATFFDDTKARAAASGRFAGNRTLPQSYVVSYTYGEKAKKTTLAFAGDRVAKISNVPPLKKRGKDWVPVAPRHLASVVDPISAALVRASEPEAVCGRTIRFFDGELRGDLKLLPLDAGPVDTGAYKGEAVRCSGKFVPVAGYRPGNKSMRYLRDKSPIRITFAPLGETGVYAPIEATVGTQIGTITLSARRISNTN
jgi:hypothetical protein